MYVFILENLILFCFWATFQRTLVQHLTKLFQCCFLNVEATLMNIRWLNFHFQLTINVETTLGHREHRINVILSMLFQRCFVNVETTSINIHQFNFHCQTNFNFETTLVHRRWIDVILSTLFQRCFANVETTTINYVGSTFIFNQISTLKQRWWTLTINIVSTLIERWCVCWVWTALKWRNQASLNKSFQPGLKFIQGWSQLYLWSKLSSWLHAKTSWNFSLTVISTLSSLS